MDIDLQSLRDGGYRLSADGTRLTCRTVDIDLVLHLQQGEVILQPRPRGAQALSLGDVTLDARFGELTTGLTLDELRTLFQ